MPVARLLRLLLTLLVPMMGLSSLLGWAVVGSFRGEEAPAPAARPMARSALELANGPRHTQRSNSDRVRPRLAADDVGHPATPCSGRVRQRSRGRSGLLGFFPPALAAAGEAGAEHMNDIDVGDAPDLVDDDGPQGFVAGVFPAVWKHRHPAPYLEPNLWGIQPSTGHPRGDDEPPRV